MKRKYSIIHLRLNTNVYQKENILYMNEFTVEIGDKDTTVPHRLKRI